MCYVSTDERRQGAVKGPLGHVLQLPQEQDAALRRDPSADQGTDEAQGLPTARRGRAIVLERPPIPLWRPRYRQQDLAGTGAVEEHAADWQQGLRRRRGRALGVGLANDRIRHQDEVGGVAEVSRNLEVPPVIADGRESALELSDREAWRRRPWLVVAGNGSSISIPTMGHAEHLGPFCRLHRVRRRLGWGRFALLASLLVSSALLALLAACTALKCHASLAELRAR